MLPPTFVSQLIPTSNGHGNMFNTWELSVEDNSNGNGNGDDDPLPFLPFLGRKDIEKYSKFVNEDGPLDNDDAAAVLCCKKYVDGLCVLPNFPPICDFTKNLGIETSMRRKVLVNLLMVMRC